MQIAHIGKEIMTVIVPDKSSRSSSISSDYSQILDTVDVDVKLLVSRNIRRKIGCLLRAPPEENSRCPVVIFHRVVLACRTRGG